MQGESQFFRKSKLIEELAVIRGISFTPREIDIISCLMHMRGPQKISSLLALSPNTVVSHIRNIKLKIGCNSREGIFDFIEPSLALPLINKHYAHLILHGAFEKCLKDLAVIKRIKKQAHLLIYEKNQSVNAELIDGLQKHLKQAGIDVIFTSLGSDEDEIIEELKNTHPSLILFLEKTDREKLPKELQSLDFLDFPEHQTGGEPYYFFVFEILKKLLHPINITGHLQGFHERYGSMTTGVNDIHLPSKIKENRETFYKKGSLTFVVPCFIFACYSYYVFIGSQKMPTLQDLTQEKLKKAFIRSDLPLPISSILLGRAEEIAQIDAKLKGDKGIQTMALVGPGGIGKTTLARQYALLQKIPIIWEINAETESTLLASFETLALALAQTEEETKEVKGLQEIKNSTEKADKIVQWVQNHLSLSKSWFLIFDNVINFKNIQKYFPSNQNAWGMGQVLITTRNTQMQNINIQSILPLKELNDGQKLGLFTNILISGSEVLSLTPSQVEEAKTFLKDIPPYPLDVAIAAYYLKRTNVPYGKYLGYLKDYDGEFETLQKEFLEELGHYHKTRHSIIALSLKELVEAHKDFSALLLFISLLNSQGIPRDLLSTLKKDLIVDNFIQHLKTYSLIIDAHPFREKPSLSLHHSIQENSLIYLRKTLELDKNTHFLKSLVHTLESYISDSIREQDFDKIKGLVSHCHAFLGHTDLLTEESRNMISGELGNIYLQLSNYKAAQEILEETLERLHKHTSQNREPIARFSVYLADVYREAGDYGRAKTLLEESIHIYRKYFPERYESLALSLAHLGAVYRHLGNFKKSRDLLRESIALYQKHSLDNGPDFAWALVHLGNTYREMGNFSKATTLLEKSILIYNKEFSQNHPTTAWNMAQLGNMYRELGKYDKATSLLEKSLAIYERYFPYSYDRMAWNLTHLGDIYTYLGDHAKAITVLEKALSIHEKYFSKNHVGVARTLMCLGNAYRASGDYKRAKDTLEKSLNVHLRHFSEKHLRLAPVYMNLGIIHQELGHSVEAKALLQKSLEIYELNEGDHSIERARVLRSLGFVVLLEGHFDAAEKFFHQALEISQQSNHPDLFKTWEALAGLYIKQSTLMQAEASQVGIYRKQAAECLLQALKVIEAHLSNNKHHRTRIQNKMEKFCRQIDFFRNVPHTCPQIILESEEAD